MINIKQKYPQSQNSPEVKNEKTDSFPYEKMIFVLRSSETEVGETIKEYIPENETFDNYGLLFAIRTDTRFNRTPKEYRDEIIQNLKFQDKNGGVAFAEKYNEFVLYFTVNDPNGKFVEYNAFKYVSNDEGNGVKSYQVVLRDFADGRFALLKNQDNSVALFQILDRIITAKQGVKR